MELKRNNSGILFPKKFLICEFCLLEFIASSKILEKSKYVCCKNCKSLAAHWTNLKLSGSKHEWFINHRKPVNFEYLCNQETIDKFGYNISELLPFSTKKIVAKCRFCLKQFNVMMGKVTRNNFKPTCKQCCNIASAYSRLDNLQNEHEYFKAQISKKKRVIKFQSKIYDANFVNIEATLEKFGYEPSDLAPKSRKKVILCCEFCLKNFEARKSKLSITSKAVCCKECGGICISYFKQKTMLNKHEFYSFKQSDIASIDYSLVDIDKTITKFGYSPKKIHPFSQKKIAAFCYRCKSSIITNMYYYSISNSGVSCKSCMRYKTISTLQKKYGVSSVLDIPSVQKKYKHSSIELSVSDLLNSYKIEFISPFTIDCNSFQYSFDFYITSCNLLIECQGDYFHNFKENGYSGTSKDRSKMTYIQKYTKYRLIHIWEHEIHLGRLRKILHNHIPSIECLPKIAGNTNNNYLDPKTGFYLEPKTVKSIANKTHMNENEFVAVVGLILC